MLSLIKLGFATALVVSLLSVFQIAGAAELQAGTVIKASNLDQLKNDTFEGHTITDLITKRMEWMIRKHGLTLKLAHSKPVPQDPRFLKLTKEHAGETKYNVETRDISNWSGAGLPFPYSDISVKDPGAAGKLVWDFYLSQASNGDLSHFPRFIYLLIDGNKGLERTQIWQWYRAVMMGRIAHKPAVLDGGKVLYKTQITGVYPRDIRGLGTLSIRYMADKQDTTYAYLPAVRRVRRLSGGAWMDPIGGTDQLQDDINIWNARPNWYTNFKLLKKRWLLVPANEPFGWNEKGDSDATKYTFMNLKDPPYWNTTLGFEPREVYVVEADAPAVHPYSKKIMYMDAKIPWIWAGEAFDKKGQFWKWFWWAEHSTTCKNGTANPPQKVMWPAMGAVLDYQRMHATVFLGNNNWQCNPPGLKPSDVSLSSLMQAGH